MDGEGMEALLDFADFALDIHQIPADVPKSSGELSASGSQSSKETESSGDDMPVNTSAGTDHDQEPSSGSSGSTPPKRKRKHIGEAETAAKFSRAGDVESQSEGGRRGFEDEPSSSRGRRDEDEDEEGSQSPLDQDFESDFMDLMPNLKEEFPEDVAERQKLQLLISHLSEEQLNRYEVYRRASFPKAAVRRIIQTVAGCTVSQNAVIAMAGIAKMHVGEIVEMAIDVKEQWEDTGPVQPKHIREALRKLRNQSSTTTSKFRKRIQTQTYP